MITIKDAGYARGYSPTDHLLDDNDMMDVIGQQFRSAREAMNAAVKLKTASSPVYLHITFADGTDKRLQEYG
jgi:hypothetical protein